MSQRKRLAADNKGRAGEDLEKITGIGPAVAERLRHAGVTTCRDLAARTPEQLAESLGDVAGMSAQRIAHQDWIGQARRLAGFPPETSEDEFERHQHYATFHVELLVGPDGEIRRTQSRHYQSDAAESWPGWDPDQLMAFLYMRASIDRTARTTPVPVLPPSPIRVESLGPTDDSRRRSFMLDDQPVAIRLALVVDPDDSIETDTTEFTARVVARTVGSLTRHAVGGADGTLTVGEPMPMELSGPPLPPGLYFFEADVAIWNAGHAAGDEPLFRRRVPGELVHVSPAAPRLRREPTAAPASRR